MIAFIQHQTQIYQTNRPNHYHIHENFYPFGSFILGLKRFQFEYKEVMIGYVQGSTTDLCTDSKPILFFVLEFWDFDKKNPEFAIVV